MKNKIHILTLFCLLLLPKIAKPMMSYTTLTKDNHHIFIIGQEEALYGFNLLEYKNKNEINKILTDAQTEIKCFLSICPSQYESLALPLHKLFVKSSEQNHFLQIIPTLRNSIVSSLRNIIITLRNAFDEKNHQNPLLNAKFKPSTTLPTVQDLLAELEIKKILFTQIFGQEDDFLKKYLHAVNSLKAIFTQNQEDFPKAIISYLSKEETFDQALNKYKELRNHFECIYIFTGVTSLLAQERIISQIIPDNKQQEFIDNDFLKPLSQNLYRLIAQYCLETTKCIYAINQELVTDFSSLLIKQGYKLIHTSTIKLAIKTDRARSIPFDEIQLFLTQLNNSLKEFINVSTFEKENHQKTSHNSSQSTSSDGKYIATNT
jgi:hypothetical protein